MSAHSPEKSHKQSQTPRRRLTIATYAIALASCLITCPAVLPTLVAQDQSGAPQVTPQQTVNQSAAQGNPQQVAPPPPAAQPEGPPPAQAVPETLTVPAGTVISVRTNE